MKLSKKQQQTLIIAVAVVVGGLYAYWNFGWKPTSEKIARLSGELDKTRAKVESMKQTAQRLPQLQKDYETLLAEVGETEKRLPKQKSLQDILRIVTEQSIKHRISVTSFAPGAERQEQYFSEVPISLNVVGHFHPLGKFLAALGLQERILSSRGLNLTTSTKKGQTISGTFTLLAYTFKG
jgi:type IV pilus assembly protein PilO